MNKQLLVDDSKVVFDDIFQRDMLAVNYRPATPAEIMEAYREICKAEGKKQYRVNGEEVWLTPYAGEVLDLSIRHWEAKG